MAVDPRQAPYRSWWRYGGTKVETITYKGIYLKIYIYINNVNVFIIFNYISFVI